MWLLGVTTARAAMIPCHDVLDKWSSNNHLPLLVSNDRAETRTSTSNFGGTVVVSSRTALMTAVEATDGLT